MKTTHDKAAEWANAYFSNRGWVPTASQYRMVYDMALGHFLKIDNAE